MLCFDRLPAMARFRALSLCVVAALAAVLLLCVGACGGEENPAEARQLARINADLAAMTERLDALERRLDQALADRAAPESDVGEPADESAKVSAKPAPPELAITVLADGAQVRGAPMTDDALRAEIAALVARSADAQVVIEARPDIAHARVVALIDLVKAAGVSRFALRTTAGRAAPSTAAP